MATIFPNHPTGTLHPEVLRTFRVLKSLPDDYRVWHHLAPWQPNAPDFLIHNPQAQVLLLKVSTASVQEAHPAAQLLLLESEQPPLGEAEERVLTDFITKLEQSNGYASPSEIPTAVLFPNIPAKQLKRARTIPKDQSPRWLGKEFLQSDALSLWEQTFTSPALDESQWAQLRQTFTPEVVVPPELTIRKAPIRHIEAELTGFLLDYNQEAAMKNDLSLGSGGADLAQDFRLNLVNGVTGSGKTLILLYRLRLLDELYPDKKFLVLTHNRPLIRDLEARYYRLTGLGPPNIHWHTFNGWCRIFWPPSEQWRNPIGENKRHTIIRQIREQVLPGSKMTAGMLRSEINWVKDNDLTISDAYLEADRRGRGFGLGQAQRAQVFTAIQQYQKRLAPRVDWADIPLKMWKFIQGGQVALPQYDVVLVDEAQFFAPVWFEIVQTLVKPQTGHLFLTADPTQGFLRQGISWKSVGLEIRGRSYHLRRSYRTTHAILDFATRFYQVRVPDDIEGAEILAPDLQAMPAGIAPQLVRLTSPQDEISRVANEVVSLVREGLPRKDILALHVTAQGAQRLIAAIDRQSGRGTALDPKDSHPGNYVRVTTINAGTGLEAPIVFLVGLNQLFEEEQSLRFSVEERTEMIWGNTRKVYMAATRAGQRLVITYVGQVPDVLTKLVNNF